MKFNPTTPILLLAKESAYLPGQGATIDWVLLSSGRHHVYYCEWKGSYGDRAFSAEALGVKDSATVRTFYNPGVYEKLRSVQVIVIKNADESAFINGVPDKSNPNVYELWGSVDNVLEENQFMEFRVRRYEGL